MDRDSKSRKGSGHHKRSDRTGSQTQKYNIPYLLNETPEERPDEVMVDVEHEPQARSHRQQLPSSSHRDSYKFFSSTGDIKEEKYGTKRDSKDKAKGSRYKCSYCGQECASRNALEEHISRQHKPKAFQCDQCGSTFTEKGNLNNNERPWVCSQCGMSFPFRDSLNARNSRHVDAVHQHLRPFPCPQCLAKFKKRAHLQRHQQTVCRPKSSSSGRPSSHSR